MASVHARGVQLAGNSACSHPSTPPATQTLAHPVGQTQFHCLTTQKRNDKGFADGVMELRPADKAATLYDMEGKVRSS